MTDLIPKAVDAVLTQLQSDGMGFQSYKLSGNAFRAVLVLRFASQKPHFSWIDRDIMGNETSMDASAASTGTHSETQDTSYMAIPEYYHHVKVKGSVPCHDSGVDLNGSEPLRRDSSEEFLSQTSVRTTEVQTDLDLEYMRRLMDEFNAREYRQSGERFAGKKKCEDSSDSEHEETVRVRTREKQCQTDSSLSVNDQPGSGRCSPEDTKKTDGILDTISKAIQTVGYLEEYIQRSPDSRALLSLTHRDQCHVSAQTDFYPSAGKQRKLIETLSVDSLDSDELNDEILREFGNQKVSCCEQECQTESRKDKNQRCQVDPIKLGMLDTHATQTPPDRKVRSRTQYSQTEIEKKTVLIQLNQETQTECEVEQVEVSNAHLMHNFDPFQTFEDYTHSSSESRHSVETVDAASSTISVGLSSIGTDPHVSLGEIPVPETPSPPETSDTACQTEQEKEKEEEPSIDFFSKFLSGRPPPPPPPKQTLQVAGTLGASTIATQTAKCAMVSRGVGIRVKKRDEEIQTEANSSLPPLMVLRPDKKDSADGARSPITVFRDVPPPQYTLQRSATLDAAHKKKKKRKATKSNAADYSSIGQLIRPSTSSAPLTPAPMVQTVTRVYDEDDFRVYVQGLAVRQEPVIQLQSGVTLGAIRGVLRLRSGSQDLWVEALYLCVLSDAIVPLYCSGGRHKRCMPGQIIDRRRDEWHREFAVFKAKGSYESANPGMPDFEAAEACCQATMGATPTDSLGATHKGKRNSCSNQ